MEKQDFEKGYLAYLDDVIKTIRTRVEKKSRSSFPSSSAQAQGKARRSRFERGWPTSTSPAATYKEARPFADKALELKPHHPLASYVKARLLITIGDDDAALEVLEPALDPKHPNERVIDLLAELKMKAGQLDEAETLYEMAHNDDPFHITWISWLARIHLRQKNTVSS